MDSSDRGLSLCHHTKGFLCFLLRFDSLIPGSQPSPSFDSLHHLMQHILQEHPERGCTEIIFPEPPCLNLPNMSSHLDNYFGLDSYLDFQFQFDFKCWIFLQNFEGFVAFSSSFQYCYWNFDSIFVLAPCVKPALFFLEPCRILSLFSVLWNWIVKSCFATISPLVLDTWQSF